MQQFTWNSFIEKRPHDAVRKSEWSQNKLPLETADICYWLNRADAETRSGILRTILTKRVRFHESGGRKRMGSADAQPWHTRRRVALSSPFQSLCLLDILPCSSIATAKTSSHEHNWKPVAIRPATVINRAWLIFWILSH